MSGSIIVGSGRGGTTWVLDVIAKSNDLNPIFEPLLPNVIPGANQYANRYLPPNYSDERLEDIFNKILLQEMHGLWINYRIQSDRLVPQFSTGRVISEARIVSRRIRKLFYNYLKFRPKQGQAAIVKCIRANLLLGWISSNISCPVALIVRHPGAVIESKMRLDAIAKEAGLIVGADDWDPYVVLNHYLSDELLRRDYLDQYLDQLNWDTLTPIEANTVIWCIENMVPLRQSNIDNIHVCSYEHLVMNKNDVWESLISHLGLDNVPGEDVLNTPSQQSSADFINHQEKNSRLGRWMSRFSKKDLDSMDRILHIFDVEVYDMQHELPLS